MQSVKKGKFKMFIWIIFLIYIFMSATGLYLIKIGTADSGMNVENGVFGISVSIKLLIGFIVYVCSFLLSVYLVSQMNVSIFYPVGMGSVLVLTCLSGYFLLKEHIGIQQLIGIILILAGIIIMNVKK